jgi:hypothetical protein
VTAPAARRDLTRVMALGAIAWAAYAILHVVFTGVVLDETVEPAQIITGAVTYPAGHPHEMFYRSAFSLSNYSSAAIYYFWPDPAVVSFVRNCLFLFVTVFGVYALTLALTRRVVWSLVAAALVLLEALKRFGGVYPLPIFPGYYSNGPLGLMCGVLAVALWLGGRRRGAALLVGVLPCIHLALAAPVCAWACAEIALDARRHGLARLRPVLVSLLAGIAFSIALAVFIQTTARSAVDAAAYPYQAADEGSIVAEHFRVMTDVHRAPYSFLRLGYLDNLAAFAGLAIIAVLLARGDESARGVASVILLGSIAWGYVVSTWLFEGAAGWLPGAVLVSMPGRFSNYPAVLLVPLTVFVLATWLSKAPLQGRGSVVIMVAATLLVAAILSSRLVTGPSSATVGTKLLIVIWGLIFGSIAGSSSGRLRLAAVITIATLGGVFVLQRSATGAYSYFLVAAGCGLLGSLVPAHRSSRLEHALRAACQRAPAMLLVAVCLAALSKVVGDRADAREPQFVRWDMVSPDDRAIRDWIARNAGPQELVLTTLVPRSGLQGKVERPVLFELETLWLMAYQPRLASIIGAMARDLYGVDYADPGALHRMCGGRGPGMYCSVWTDAWKGRPREEWKGLSHKYGFRLVVAPSTLSLDLPVAVAGSRWTLYEISAAGPQSAIRPGARRVGREPGLRLFRPAHGPAA